MLPAAALAQALEVALPGEHRWQARALAEAILAASSGEKAAPLSHELAQALATLAGREVPAGSGAISFGEGGQVGDVTIHDGRAGGNVVRVTLTIAEVSQQVTVSGGSTGPIIGKQVNYNYAGERPAQAPAFQVPNPPNPLFRGRDAELATLAEALLGDAGGTAAVLPAVSGTGGIGKTQLASEFAHRHRGDFPGGVFWLSMERPEGVAGQVAACAGPGGLDFPGWERLDFASRVAAVRRAWQEPVARLLVFDNLEEPGSLQEWRPVGGGSRVLVTTRRGVWARSSGVRPVPLQTLARPESVHLLLAPRWGDDAGAALADPATAQEADAICEQVGDLPLALALAGAYLESYPSLSLAGYRRRLEAELLAHPSLEADLEEELPTRHAQSVRATIALSYGRLDPQKPADALALTLLHSAAHLAPAPIPNRLLVRLADRDPDDEGQAAEADAPLRRLAAVGLIELLPDGDAALHRLVAAFVREQRIDGAAVTASVATALATESYQLNQAGYPLRGQPYVAHLLHQLRPDSLIMLASAAVLAGGLGALMMRQGDFTGAKAHLERALAIGDQALGPSHPLTATNHNHLGHVLQVLGDYREARQHLERGLAIRERIYGTGHADTISSIHTIGKLLQAEGNLAEAHRYFERSLALREQALGPDHLHTATSLNDLGMVLQAQGNLNGARILFERTLAIYERELGPDHPFTATNINNLGLLLRAQGDLAGARRYFERALAISEQTLGPKHLDTARVLNNLGVLLRAQGDLANARQYYERSLAIREQRLGSGHPDVAKSLMNLGYLLQTGGDLTGALPYMQRALAIYERTLDPSHPEMATALNNLGGLLQAQGRFSEARPNLQSALAIRERVLGAGHPDTASSLNNLGTLLLAQGDLDAAHPLFERALALREHILGLDHPDTAQSLANMGFLLQTEGDLARARPLFERALAIFTARLGPQHPTTQVVQRNLASLDRPPSS